MRKIILFFLLSIGIFNFVYAFDVKSKNTTVIIPFPPGGGVDQTFRHFEKYANEKGITFVPIYKAGAEGLIGMNEIAGSPKDGSYISFTTVGAIATQQLNNPKTDIEVITATRLSIFAIFVHKDSQIKSFDDLMTEKEITFANGAPGQKAVIEQMSIQSKKKINPLMVSYKGGAPAIQDVIGRHIEVGVVPVQLIAPHFKSGTIRILAVTSKAPYDDLPSVPSIYNYFPQWKNYEAQVVVMPKDSNPAAIKFWSELLTEYTSNKNVRSDFIKEYTELAPTGKSFVDSAVKSNLEFMSNFKK